MIPIDVERARAATPGCADLAFFNAAGAALPTATVLAAQVEHLEREARMGGYEAHDAVKDRIEAVSHSLARLIGADRAEIALSTSNTTALHLLVYSLALGFGPGDRILTTTTEYGANYVAYLQLSKRTGATVEVVPDNELGELDVGALAAMIDDRVRLIAVNHVPTNGGLVNPAAKIGRIANDAGIPFLLDACQSTGQIPIDVDEIGCDALTATGRKYLRGPRGSAFLYVRRALLETVEPLMLDHDTASWIAPDRYELKPDASRFETWERNYAAVLGLGQATDEALAWGVEAIHDRIGEIAETLRARLTQEVPGATVHDLGTHRCGIVTFSLSNEPDVDEVQRRLHAQGIVVSVVPPASALLDTLRRDLPPMLRASVHVYNNDTDLDRLVHALR